MIDMLVTLARLPRPAAPQGVVLRRGLAAERRVVVAWTEQRFGQGWAGELDTAFAQVPARVVLALADRAVLGFAAWDVAALGLFGPLGVDAPARRAGLGAALALTALAAMQAQGYAYAVVAGAARPDWYARVLGAVPIEGPGAALFTGLARG